MNYMIYSLKKSYKRGNPDFKRYHPNIQKK
ncbi:hypothetical protein DFO77_106149 [Marinilabilia salmonicolor]|jgi:hypothetical protein|uniref:Uncharacterized protein n=1 Tax=Marinilabilia salmonicolor TaxID=989 RepID=A0A2T0XLB7_9BACT|nr:hypothetical protein BY457_10815 [Marinilabilia salmonicolor]RCW37455.1 hypothetical protein DFO77_106149 [Marinilabilia salmonicolor]